jgi:hypothetical protein
MKIARTARLQSTHSPINSETVYAALHSHIANTTPRHPIFQGSCNGKAALKVYIRNQGVPIQTPILIA